MILSSLLGRSSHIYDGRRLCESYCVRLHSALDYIAPLDYMNGLSAQIWAERNRRL